MLYLKVNELIEFAPKYQSYIFLKHDLVNGKTLSLTFPDKIVLYFYYKIIIFYF